MRCVLSIAPQPPEFPPSCIWGDPPSALPTPRQVLFDEFSGWALKRGLEMLDDEPEEGEESLLAQHKSSAEVAAEGAKDTAAKMKAINERDARLKTMGAVGDAEDLAENKVRHLLTNYLFTTTCYLLPARTSPRTRCGSEREGLGGS